MAYARKGERGSDIYLWKDSLGWHCTDCTLTKAHASETFGTSIHHASLLIMEDPKHGEHWSQLGLHLLQHVAAGHCVPDDVFNRLRAEMDGLPYETDVERGVREARESNDAG